MNHHICRVEYIIPIGDMLYVNKVDDAAIDKTIEDITDPAADNKTETDEFISLHRIPETQIAYNTC